LFDFSVQAFNYCLNRIGVWSPIVYCSADSLISDRGSSLAAADVPEAGPSNLSLSQASTVDEDFVVPDEEDQAPPPVVSKGKHKGKAKSG
jgi:hypothetical protein